MKKLMLGISALLLLAGVQANATSLIDNDASKTKYTVIANGVTYNVLKLHQATDTWQGTGYTGTDFTGVYIGTVNAANEFAGDMQNLMNYYLGVPYTTTYDFLKAEANNNWATGDLVVTLDTDGKTGSWELSGGYSTNFYTVKGGTSYALYYVDPSAVSGDWTTAHLQEAGNSGAPPAISHLKMAVDSTPVPEPATMLLFGAGLAGLAGFARRKVQ